VRNVGDAAGAIASAAKIGFKTTGMSGTPLLKVVALDAMVKIADAIDSGAIHRSIPVFELDDSRAEHSTDRQALNTHISDVLRAVNTPGAGLLLYTLPDTLDLRVVVGGSGSVYIVACNPPDTNNDAHSDELPAVLAATNAS
jgi:hypothetical protein